MNINIQKKGYALAHPFLLSNKYDLFNNNFGCQNFIANNKFSKIDS
jgi:hypothetical protein